MRRLPLRNGLTVILVPMVMEHPVAGVVLGIRGGSRYDPQDQPELHHSLEHLMLRATRKHPSWAELARYARPLCKDLNGETDETTIIFEGLTLSSKVEKVIRLLAEIVTQPLITVEQLQSEIERLKEELAEEDWLVSALKSFLFLGRLESNLKALDQFTTADLRQFYQKLFVGERLVLVVAGSFDPEKVGRVIRQSFGDLRRGLVSELPTLNYKKVKSRLILRRKPGDKKVSFILAFPTPGFGDPNRIPLGVIRNLLTTGDGSRLRIELDSLGYGYTSSGEIWFLNDIGWYYFGVALFPEKFQEALAIIAKVLRELRWSLVKVRDLRDEQENLKIRALDRFSQPLEVAKFCARQFINLGEVVSLNEYLRLIKGVKPKDIRRVAASIFVRKRMILVATGPIPRELTKKEIRKILRFH